MTPPFKPFDTYKWRWLSVQPSEGLLEAPVFIGILRALQLHEGEAYSSMDLYRELQRVQSDTETNINIARSPDRNLFRNSGQYWRGTGLLSETRGQIQLTSLGHDVAAGNVTNDEFAALMVRNTVLPNPATYSDAEIQKWRNAPLRIKPLEIILNIMDGLGKAHGLSEASLSPDELIKIVIPLVGDRRDTDEIVDCVYRYRSGRLNVDHWPDCAPAANDKRLAREFLLFLENFGVCRCDHSEDNSHQRFLIDQTLDEGIGDDAETFTEDPDLLASEIERSRSSQIPTIIERQRVNVNVLRRTNQAGFRRNVLREANTRCLLSNEEIPDVLEAAHIIPVTDGGSDDVSNGFCLRVDLHRLYDGGKIRITSDGRVLTNRQVQASVNYGALPNQITIPPSVNMANIEWRMRYR